MRLIATAPLALAVSRSGGLGFLGTGTDPSSIFKFLNDSFVLHTASPIPDVPEGILPVGIGFICWGADLNEAKSVIADAPSKPAAAWLFAARELSDLPSWSEEIRTASNGKTKIWIQVGTVADCLEVAKSCKPDVLVIQGSDAGGHGLAQSSSIISLLPECVDALEREGFGHIPLIATGGIVDGRGTAAALTLGAVGTSMGTRFLASPEAAISQGYQAAVLAASDGGVSTARTTVYDKIRGILGWPSTYNGRGILNQSFWDYIKGMNDDENRQLYDAAAEQGDAGWGNAGRMTTYAGTGVGLIREVKPAAEIVKEVRKDARKALASVNERFR
jgi:nitronate monooxygenase